MNLEERKNALLKKRESLIKSEKPCSSTALSFLGRCTGYHLIETNIDKNIHGIQSGEFINITYGNCEHIALCIGLGNMCDEDPHYSKDKKVLWFLEEDCSGISYWHDSNINIIMQKARMKIELI
jgi:hypothetical protein